MKYITINDYLLYGAEFFHLKDGLNRQVRCYIIDLLTLKFDDIQSECANLKVGERLARKIVSFHSSATGSIDPPLENTCASVLSILLEEYHTHSELNRLTHLEIFIAAWVSLSNICDKNCEKHICTFVLRQLTIHF
jgi:hypothetical protein